MIFWNNALKVGGIVVVGIFAYVALGTNIIAHLSSWNSEQIELGKWVLGGTFFILFFLMLNHDSPISNDNEYIVPRKQEIDLDTLLSIIPEENQKNNFGMEDSNIIEINGLMYVNQPFVLKYTWNEAKEMLENFELEGYSDWRLPTIDELVKLGTNKAISKEVEYSWKDFYIREEFIESMPTRHIYNLEFWTSEIFSIDNSSWLKRDIEFYAHTINYFEKISKYSKTYSYKNINRECYVMYVRNINGLY